MSFSSIDLGLQELFEDPARRQAFFRAITQDEIACSIRALRKERGLNQTEFAALAGMKQSAISRIEQADYAAWNFNTLFRVADALGARIRVLIDKAEDAVLEYLQADDASADDSPSSTELVGKATKATNPTDQRSARDNTQLSLDQPRVDSMSFLRTKPKPAVMDMLKQA